MTVRQSGAQIGRGGPLGGDITRAVVRLYHERIGKGPTKGRTYIADDVVVCVLEDVATPAEKTLMEAGQAELLRTNRTAVRETIEPELKETVEHLSGRRVRAMLGDHRPEEDLTALVFVLDPGEVT